MLIFDISGNDQSQSVCEAEYLDLDPAVFSALGVQVKHERHADGRRLRISAEANVSLICDRTLQIFSRKIAGDHEIALLQAGESAKDLPGAYHLVLGPCQTQIDLTAIVRDTLLLAVPVRKVAPEAEELDIPIVFGAPDEPECWEALRQIQVPVH